MQETESIDEYILQHIDAESDYLKALYRDTHVKLLRPRIASGHLQGRRLKMFVEMIRPRHISRLFCPLSGGRLVGGRNVAYV